MRRDCSLVTSAILVATSLSGCGTYVPSIQEIPYNSSEGNLLVQAIAESVRCQIQQSVKYIIDQDKRAEKQNGFRTASWFDYWGVGYALTLTIIERSSAGPNIVWAPPSPLASVFTVGAGVSLSATATRVETLNFFYSVKELYQMKPCEGKTKAQYRLQSLLIQDDLKFKDSLVNYVFVLGSGAGKPPGGTEAAFSSTIKFQVVSGGAVSPAWKMERLDVNQSGAILAGSRDRTHEVTATFGPVDETTGQFEQPAAQAFFNQQVRSALQSQ